MQWFHDTTSEFVDCFRRTAPDTVAYTCWNQKTEARYRNEGLRWGAFAAASLGTMRGGPSLTSGLSRIDYALVDKAFAAANVVSSGVELMPMKMSDHAAISLVLKSSPQPLQLAGNCTPRGCAHRFSEFKRAGASISAMFGAARKKGNASTSSAKSGVAAQQTQTRPQLTACTKPNTSARDSTGDASGGGTVGATAGDSDRPGVSSGAGGASGAGTDVAGCNSADAGAGANPGPEAACGDARTGSLPRASVKRNIEPSAVVSASDKASKAAGGASAAAGLSGGWANVFGARKRLRTK